MTLKEHLLRTQVVYQGRYLRTEEQTVRLPDGREALREIVSPPDAVAVLPISDDGRVHLIRQYRTAIRQVTIEIPAGIINPGESPEETGRRECEEETGRRECEEETGFRPGRLERMFGYYHSVGFSTGRIEVYLGTGLTAAPHARPDDGEHLERLVIPFDEFYEQAVDGRIVDSKTILSALWYRHRIRK
jgi:ADP-ribose pyrophosphatase